MNEFCGKRFCYGLAIIVLIYGPFPTLNGPAYSEGDIVYISQSGGSNDTGIDQSLGEGHFVNVMQEADMQNGSLGDNLIRVVQSNDNQSAEIVQDSGSDASAGPTEIKPLLENDEGYTFEYVQSTNLPGPLATPFSNIINVEQKGGADNAANVSQNAQGYNVAHIGQEGSNNRLFGADTEGLLPDEPATQISQSGNNLLFVVQKGDDNQIGLYQEADVGESNKAEIIQEGDKNSVQVVNQIGEDTHTKIVQIGNNNIDPLVQMAHNGQVDYFPTQIGDNNEIWLANERDASIDVGAPAEQTATGNGSLYAEANQIGNNNLAGLNQKSVHDSFAYMTQDGNDNRLSVVQGDFEDNGVAQSNRVEPAEQRGDDNQAYLVQNTQGDNRATLKQTGDGNRLRGVNSEAEYDGNAVSRQLARAGENTFDVEQTGDNNRAGIRQESGIENFVQVMQEGAGHLLSVNQTASMQLASRNYLEAEQFGANNQATIRQTAGGLNPEGYENYAEVSQLQSDNHLDAIQTSSAGFNYLKVTQSFANTAIIRQFGSAANVAVISQ